MQTLYCFKVDDATGDMEKYEITDYEYLDTGNYQYRPVYRFMSVFSSYKCKYSVRVKNIDKYVSHKLFTFNPDTNRAVSLIRKELKRKADAARREMRRYDALSRKIEGI